MRVITATMRRIPPSTHPEVVAQAEQTLAHAARRFDPAALGRIAERLLAHLDPDGSAPSEEPETMRELRVRTRPDGTVTLNGKLDPEGGARVLEVLGSLNGRRPPVDGVPDQRSPARRDADALVEAMSRLLDEGELPTRGGQRPHLVLTMGLNDLIDSIGSAVLDTGGCVSAGEARRMACDAALIPMVLGSDSMPLDVGRHQRLATAALRDALATTTTPSCTGKDGTSDSTPAATLNSFLPRSWTPLSDHSTTHSGSNIGESPRLPRAHLAVGDLPSCGATR